MDPHAVVESAQHVTEPSLWTVIWGVVTTVLAGGATFVAGLTKWTIHREMERNDERHDHTEQRADKLEEAMTQLTRNVVTGPDFNAAITRMEQTLTNQGREVREGLASTRRELQQGLSDVTRRVDAIADRRASPRA